MSNYMNGVNSIYNHNSITANAYWYYERLDSRSKINKDNVQDIVKHFDDCTKNPTRGLIARKMCETNYYPYYLKRNLSDLKNFEEARTAEESFKKCYNTMYPKTGKLREFLIDSRSIVLHTVKPIEKTLRRALFMMFKK